MIPAWSYWTVLDALERRFKARRRNDRKWDVILAGLLFARPSSKLVAEEILADLATSTTAAAKTLISFVPAFPGHRFIR
jgi:hypothetical protein